MDDSLFSEPCPNLTSGWLAHIPVRCVLHFWLRCVHQSHPRQCLTCAHHAAWLTQVQHHTFAFTKGLLGLSHWVMFSILFLFSFKHQTEEDA